MSKNQTQAIKSLLKLNQWKEHHARAVLDFWEQSGLNLKQFSREYGIGYKRLQYWKKRIKVSCAAIEFIEVIPVESRQPSVDDRMDIMLSNHRVIRVRPGFDESATRQLIQIVEE